MSPRPIPPRLSENDPPVSQLWEQLPASHRQHLLVLLSQLVIHRLNHLQNGGSQDNV